MSTAAAATLRVAQHFEACDAGARGNGGGGGKGGGRRARVRCRHCGTSVSVTARKRHLSGCPSLPEEHRRALDESEVAKAAAGVGMYGSNPVYRGYQVTGWLVAQCKACLETVRGPSSALKEHRERPCRGFPATWTEVNVASHFCEGSGAGERECRHCGALVRGGNLKPHMGRCASLPEKHRRALDRSEVARAAAGAGVYGSNPVYRGFQVTGCLVAQCKACLKTVRGNSGCLKQHKERFCRGFPATWTNVDALSHFRAGKGAGEWECRHCGAMMHGYSRQAKRHMLFCRRLPEEHRRALDESEVARAAAGAGMYGSNPVNCGFQVTGWLVAQCKACLETVRGDSGALKQHKMRCVGPPADVPARATKRRRVTQQGNRGSKASAVALCREVTRSSHSSPQLAPTPGRHGAARSASAVSAARRLGEPARTEGPAVSRARTASPIMSVAPASSAACHGAGGKCGRATAAVTSSARHGARIKREGGAAGVSSSATCHGAGGKCGRATAAMTSSARHGARIKREGGAAGVSSSDTCGARGKRARAESGESPPSAARGVAYGAAVASRAAAAGGGGGASSAARHRWASGVRATRGSEAVVSAMRARYKRLYTA